MKGGTQTIAMPVAVGLVERVGDDKVQRSRRRLRRTRAGDFDLVSFRLGESCPAGHDKAQERCHAMASQFMR